MRIVMKSVASILVVFCMSAIVVAQGAAPQAPPPPAARKLVSVRLTPKVYWVKGMGFGAFIVGEKGVIVFDACRSPEAARQMQALIAKVTSKPITTMILTHSDSDHVNGLPAFPAGIRIISLEQNRKDIVDSATEGHLAPEYMAIPKAYLPNHIVAGRTEMKIEGEKMVLLSWAQMANQRPQEQVATLAHEIGHALGLAHDMRSGNAMAPQGGLWLDAAQVQAMRDAVDAVR